MRPLYSLLLTLYPELRLFDSMGESKSAFNRAIYDKGFANFRYWLKGTVVTFVCGPALMLFLLMVDWDVRLRVAFALVCCLLAAILEMFAGRKYVRRSLRRQLVKKEIPVCLECGCDLRRNQSGRCPECGTSFVVESGSESS